MINDNVFQEMKKIELLLGNLNLEQVEEAVFKRLRVLGSKYRAVELNANSSPEELDHAVSDLAKICYSLGRALEADSDLWKHFISQPFLANNRLRAYQQGTMGAVVMYALCLRSIEGHRRASDIAWTLTLSMWKNVHPDEVVRRVQIVVRAKQLLFKTSQMPW